MPKLPNKPLHVDLQVEVNSKGQVVRVPHGNLSGDAAFDTMTMGNALQMWIRRPDGSATAGLFRVDYNYDPKAPKDHDVSRRVTLLSRGGKWAGESGAATLMMAALQRQRDAALAKLREEQRKKEDEQSKNLPDINGIVKRSVLKTSPSPSPKP
ncbi:MAG TPA: hypothetical protein VGR69_09865 [Candidatus Rubrimentiphilum sp.]|nr:hypothetical protein [Candidatus Rubrimentiphilum sp.]